MSKIKFEDNSKKVLDELDIKKTLALNMIGQKAVSIWKMIITDKGIVDTGRFRNSAEFEVDKAESKVVIGSNVEYAPTLELGGKGRTGRPSLKPTVTEYAEDYKNITKQILEK